MLILLFFLMKIYPTYFFFPCLDKFNKSKNNISNTKVGLCLICKNENLYIKEFIDHYKSLGYDHIFIYDNNDFNEEKLEDITKKYINDGYISIINYKGDKQKPQFRVYIDCYEKNNKNYDWLSFFDADEFLELKPKGIKIQEFLDNKRFNNCQNIKFNWVIYSDNNKLYYENKKIQDRFTRPLFNNPLNKHIKSTVRGNLSANYWKESQNPHSGYNNFSSCSSSGKKISNISPFNEPYDYEFGYIKHYITKTLEEYVRKIKRGRADIIVTFEDYKKMFKNFVNINRMTKKKFNIFKKEFNYSFD